jgi:malonyl-CoA O-methyltransferase
MDEVPYTFDTAQVARGFLAVLDDMPEVESNLRRACDYIVNQIDDHGVIHTPSYETWKLPDGSVLHEYGNLYILPPLKFAGEKLSERKYLDAYRRAMDNYRCKPDLVEFKPQLAMLSHYFGYMMEALVDLGENELAKKGLAQAQRVQKSNGAIPAYPGVEWVCSTGLAQLALAWYKLGMKDPADKALEYMASIQNPSGGFFGSYGKGARYFPYQEISWAAKFFLEAHRERQKRK